MSSFIDNNNNNINNNNSNNSELPDLLCLSTDAIILILSKYLTIYDVSRLDIAYCNNNKRHIFLNILNNNVYIIYDHISFNRSFKYIDNAFIWIGLRKINILSILIDIGKEEYYNNINLTDKGLIGLSKHCILLNSIDISFSDYITDIGIIEIVSKSNDLHTLYINKCNSINDNNNINDIGLIKIMKYCHKLQYLNISGCNITDISINNIAINCNDLHTLDISRCWQVTNDSIINISKYCIKLLSLYICYCSSNITDIGIIEITRQCSRLVTLNITACYDVTDIGMISIASCNNLQSLDITWCNKITDIGIIKVVRQCTRLLSLKTAGTKITNTGRSMIQQLRVC